MSQENVELVRAIFVARDRGGFSDAGWAHPATPVTLPPIQDQISFPVVCRRLGINPGTFPFSQIQRTETGSEGWVLVNNWLSIWPHLR